MKTTSTLVMLVAALALAGCDGSKQSYTRTTDDPVPPEVRKEAREGLNAPKPEPDFAKDIGRDIPAPLAADKNLPPPVVTPELRRDLKDIVDDSNYTPVPNRDQFVFDTEKKMSELSDGINSLTETIETLNTDAYAKDVARDLREKREQVDMKFSELKAASREAWLEFKPAFDTAFDELNRAYEEAKAKYDNN
jgi:hypothetical protein